MKIWYTKSIRQKITLYNGIEAPGHKKIMKLEKQQE